MRILSIETSCDETAMAIVKAEGGLRAPRFRIIKNIVSSQIKIHAPYGGVVPNLAKREHTKNLPKVFAALYPKPYTPNPDLIAVTVGPGLEPALWTGIEFARDLAKKSKKPLVGVNHLEGHLYSFLFNLKSQISNLKNIFPAIGLIVSGGHTILVRMDSLARYKKIGETRDDAAGEAFDKVARLLELGYPGGPLVSALAAEAREENIKGDFPFTRPMLHDGSFDFSFSGLKTAVRNVVTKREMTGELKKQVAREFEECIADVLVAKTLRAVEEHDVRAVVMGGGVSANTYIRERLAEALEKADASAEHLVPPPELATDNALMIALAGYFHALKEDFVAAENLNARGNLKLS